MSLKGDLIAVAVAGAVLGAAAWYAKKKASEAAKALGDEAQKAWDAAKAVVPYVNPADEKNVVNQAATGFYQAFTGSTGTIGGDLYDGTHGIETTVKTDSAAGIMGTSIFQAMTGGTYDN